MAGCLGGTFIMGFTLLCSRHESTLKGSGLARPPVQLLFINSCAQRRSLTFSKTPVSIEIASRNFRHSVPRYRPLAERFQYMTRLMKRTRLLAGWHESLQ